MSPLAAAPGLDEIAAHPERACELSREARAALLTRTAALLAALAAAETASSGATKVPDAGLDDVAVLSTKELAGLWRMPEAKIRGLCRTGRLPAKKLGSKEWIIRVAALRECLPKIPLVENDNLRLSSYCDAGRAPQAPQAAPPYTVEVRRPTGHPQSLARANGGGDARNERDDQAPAAPARRTRASRDRTGAAKGTSGVHSSPKGMR